ncbi:MAG: LamG-like jellyroll fold domain-containing protein, partial [Bacteroidota bacterium]
MRTRKKITLIALFICISIFTLAQPVPDYHLSSAAGITTSGSSVTTWDSQQGSYSATQSNNSRRPVLEADGINGQPALAYDGSNDYLLLPDQNGFNTGGPFAAKTIAMVFETGSDITSRQMIYEQGGGSRGLNMAIHNGNLYLNGWNIPEDNWGPVDIHTAVEANTVYMAIIVFNSTTITAYVNGNFIGSVPVTGPLRNHSDDGALGGTVGSTKYYDNTNSKTYFQGKIAEWYSYNLALNDTDRSNLEAQLDSSYLINLTYDFKEGAVEVVHNSSWCSGETAYTTQGMTGDGPASSCNSISPESNVWFTFTASSNEASIELSGAISRASITLWDANLNELQCDIDHNYGEASLSTVSLVPGEQYYISVDNRLDHNAYKSTFGLCITDQASYDFRERAVEVTHGANWCSDATAYTTRGMTPDGPAATCNTISPKTNVWFTFIATATEITIDLNGTVSRASMTLWDENFNQLTCGNDFNYGEITISSVSLTQGQRYYVSVDNRLDHPAYKGSFGLCITDQASYDFSEGAIEVAHTSNWCSDATAYTTKGKTGDGPATGCNSISPESNVWFKFQATSPDVDIDLSGAISRATMTLFDGNFVELACGNDQTYGQISLNHSGLITGNWYYISVDNRLDLDVYKGAFGLCMSNGEPGNDKPDALTLNNLTQWTSSPESFSNEGATNDGPAPSVYTTLGSNVWFKFQAQTNGIQIKLNLGSLASGGFIVGLFDESDNEIDASRFNMGTILSSNQLVPGDWYYLSVGSSDANSGTFGLTLNDDIRNDFKADALDITSVTDSWDSGPEAYDNYYSSNDGPAPSIYTTLSNNLWFKFQ